MEADEIIADFLYEKANLDPEDAIVAAQELLALLAEQGYSVVSLNTIMLGRYEK